MIIRCENKSLSLFDKIFFEAPEPVNVAQPVVKKGKIQIKTPRKPTSNDYTQDVDAENQPTQPVEEPQGQQSDDDATDYTADGGDEQQPEEGDDGQSDDDATDYTADGDDEQQPEEGDDGQSDDDDGQQGESEVETEPAEPENGDTSTPQQRYALYQKILNIYDHIDIYMDKLEGSTNNSPDGNLVLMQVLKKLKTLSDIVYDYLIILYPKNTYLQSSVFYQTIVITIKQLIKLMENNKEFIQNHTM